MMTMNMVVVRWTNKGKQLKCQEFKLCTVTKISLSPSTISMSLSSSSSSSPTWRMGLPKPWPPIRRTLSLIGARMPTAWVTAWPVTRLAETTFLSLSFSHQDHHNHNHDHNHPDAHCLGDRLNRNQTRWDNKPYHRHITTKSSTYPPYHRPKHHDDRQEMDSFRLRTKRTC